MKEITKEKQIIPSYLVFFDTNVLLNYFHTVKHLINAYIEDKRVNVHYQIFGLVVDEYKHNFQVIVEKQRIKRNNASRELSQLLSITLKPLELSRKIIHQKAEKNLRDVGIEIINTPYSKLSLEKLAKDAAFHKPPYQYEGDKGFKDAIIAESLRQTLSTLSEITKVVFICGDGMLREYSQTFTEKHSNFKVYQSAIDFEAELRLFLLELNDQLVEELRKDAEKAFYRPGDTNSLFYTKGIVSQIHESYLSLFNNPKPIPSSYWAGIYSAHPDKKWSPIDEPKYTAGPPNFISKIDKTYTWHSNVIFQQEFREENSGFNMVVGYSPYYGNVGVYSLEFTIVWETTIDSKGKIINSQIKKITYNKPSEYPYTWALSTPTPQSGVTLAGQGTVPITPSGTVWFSVPTDENKDE